MSRSIPVTTKSSFPPGTPEEEVRRQRDEAVAGAKLKLKNIAYLAQEVRSRSGEFKLELEKEEKPNG